MHRLWNDFQKAGVASFLKNVKSIKALQSSAFMLFLVLSLLGF